MYNHDYALFFMKVLIQIMSIIIMLDNKIKIKKLQQLLSTLTGQF